MDGIIALLLSKKFTKDTVIGMGAIKGAPCQVQSINKVGKTTTITLKWEDNLGSIHTQAFDVEDGLDGVSVQNATIKPNGHLELTLSNGTVIDCGKVLPQYDTMPSPSASNEGQILQYIGTTTSSYTNGYFYECINDSGVYKWVEKSVQDSYTKGQIGSLSDLPDTSKNVIENIANIKLSVDQLSASKLSISDIDNALSDVSENPVQNKVIKLTLDQLRGSILDKLDEKEDKFRYSIMPTASGDYLNKIVEYIGTTDSTYTNGYFYQCRFDGTNYSWVQKNVQPSSGGTGGDGVVDGYYNSTDHLFYEESTFINPITGDDNTLYVSLDTNLLYRYNGLIFIRVDEATSGEDDVIDGYYKEADGKFYEEPTYTTEIIGETGKIYISDDTNIQYRWDGTQFVTISSSIDVDNALSTTSENPVQNKVISLKIDQLQGSILEKIQKKLSATADDFVVFTNDGDIADSGISKDVVPSTVSVSNKLLVASDLSVKADKVSGAVDNDIALLDSTGNLKDSTKKLSDLQDKLTEGDGIDINTNNKISVDISYLTASKIGYIPSTEKGVNNGVAELDSTGKVPSAQLPSYVDDVIEGYKDGADFYTDSAHADLITPESGKIYVDLHTDTTWRWSGTAYVQISESLALGETSTTAYRGDRGKTAYDHSQITNGNPHNVTATDVGLGNVANTGDSDTPVSGGTTKFTTGGAYTELNKKADKVASAISGHLAGLDANGNLTDSGVVANDVIQKVSTATGLLKDDGTVDTTSYAPSNKAYLTDDTAETTIDDADYFPFYDTSATGKRKTLFSSIVNKLKTTFATLVTGTFTSGNLVSLDSSGNIADSNISSNDIRKTTTLSNVTSSDAIFKISGFGLNTGSLFVIRARGGENILFALGNSSQDVAISYGYSAFRVSGTYAYKINAMTYDYANNELYVNLGNYSILSIIQISGITKYNLTITSVNSIPTTDIYEIPIQNLNSKADLSDLAPTFNTTTNYVQNDYVNYNGDIYRFTSNHNAGAWIGSDATQIVITTEFKNAVQWKDL